GCAGWRLLRFSSSGISFKRTFLVGIADGRAGEARTSWYRHPTSSASGHQASSTLTRWATFLSMPATAGLSRSCSAVLPMRPSPRARRVPRWRGDSPIELLTCVSRTLGTDGLLDLVRQDVDDRLATGLGDVLGAAEVAQRRLGRLEHVDRVRRAERLRQHVADPAELEHRAHAAAGDDARAR